jgi:hypothetical protein
MAYTTIDDPSEYFQTQLYTGDGNTTQAITNSGNSNLKPDWVWLKQRANDSANRNHMLFDSTRGSTKALSSNTTGAEDTSSGGYIQSFNTDGFTTGNSSVINKNAVTYVAWQWKANGGTTTSFSESGNNPAGAHQANTTAGFSIVTYTGTGSEGTIAHGLGATPKLIIWKRRTDNGNNWSTQGKISGIDTDRVELTLNSTGAKSSVDSRIGRQSQWSSTVFEVNTYVDQNTSSKNYVAYCFAEKKGYSKFGSYTGNITSGSDGTFVYTGFKPAWIMVKSTSNSGQEWVIFDNKRDTFNQMDAWLYANSTSAEDNSDERDVDFLSNGFKFRNAGGPTSYSGRTYIYMAFAEHPLVSSKGVPTTAR